MKYIDEWLDSVGAERDALKFKNGCYIISGRGNGKSLSALEQMKRYLEDHPDAKIVMPYHSGYSYFKELMNSVYGRKKSQHDDMPDAIASAIKEFDMKQREEMLEKSKLTNEELKRMLNNSHYGICWPSELIESCERIDRYRERKEEEEMGEHRVEPGTIIVANPDYSVSNRDGFWVIGDKVEEFGNIGFMAYRIPDCKVSNFLALPKMQRVVQMDCNNWFSIKLSYLSNTDSDDIPGWHYATRKEMEEIEDKSNHKFICHIETELHTIVRLKFIRNKVDPGIAYTVFVHYNPLGELDHALNYKTWEELSSRLMYDISMLIYTGFDKHAVAGFSEVIHKAKRVVKYCSEFNKNNEEKTVKETTEMNGYKFMVPKGVFGSKVYIQAKDSDKITYAGTLTDMHLETASGCEMCGNVDFIVDDEPMEKLVNFNRRFIKNVVFHDPATIVEWKDGTKTVVQARDGEKFDPEKGLAMAISKKAMGNKRDYYHVFKHYLKRVPEQVSICGDKVKTLTIPEELADDVMQFLKEKGEKNET